MLAGVSRGDLGRGRRKSCAIEAGHRSRWVFEGPCGLVGQAHRRGREQDEECDLDVLQRKTMGQSATDEASDYRRRNEYDSQPEGA